MRTNFNNNITFKAISLNKDEKIRVDNLLQSMDTPIKKEKAKLELFDIFDKRLQKEAKSKSGILYRQEDFLQRLYLTFFESLENIKALTTENLLKILNDTKPSKEELFEHYRKGTFSINRKISSSNDRTIESKLSEEKVLKPLSTASQEERAKQLKNVQDLAKPLPLREQHLLTQRASGKSYNQIACENKVSSTLIHNRTRRAVAKIQSNNNILPNEYELLADEFIKTFELNLSRKEVINIIINNIELTYTKIDNLDSNINNTSKLLGIDKRLFTQTALKQPSLFYQKPETIDQNIESTSKLLGIDKRLFTQTALKHPPLFCQKPETINQNIESTSKLLGIDKKLFTQAALKQPPLFSQKPETINQNIESTSKLLGIDKKLFSQAALKHPQLFYQKPETINQNIESTSKLLKIDKKLFTQTALKYPQVFSQKPETSVKKVNIIKYFKQIQGKNNEQIIFSTNSDKNLYYDILTYLVKRHDGLKRVLKQNEIVEYLQSQNKIYNFTIPKNKLADEFIEYVQEFSKSNFGKQVFNITKE